MLYAAYCVLEVKAAGTVMFENECSHFIMMTRRFTKRSSSNHMGDEDVPAVLEANFCAAVTQHA